MSATPTRTLAAAAAVAYQNRAKMVSNVSNIDLFRMENRSHKADHDDRDRTQFYIPAAEQRSTVIRIRMVAPGLTRNRMLWLFFGSTPAVYGNQFCGVAALTQFILY